MAVVEHVIRNRAKPVRNSSTMEVSIIFHESLFGIHTPWRSLLRRVLDRISEVCTRPLLQNVEGLRAGLVLVGYQGTWLT
ncbi:hypothetical protein AKJ16_DCAP08939 [Drosera capensis]